MKIRRFWATSATIFILAVSLQAKADQADFSRFQTWAKRIATNTNIINITMSGHTPAGVPCQVYVTDNSDGTSYLSMGVGTELGETNFDSEKNHYFGTFITPQANLKVSSKSIDLRYSGSYIEGGKYHEQVDLELHIDTDETGYPNRVRGKSTLLPNEQICLILDLIS